MEAAEVKARVAAVFDAASGTYDATGVDFFSVFGERLAAVAAPQPGEQALDVGCGAGACLLPVARAVGPTGHVLGVDLAPGMVERARATAAGLPHVDVQVGDAEDPPVAPGSVDLVTAALVLFFLPDVDRALHAYAQALRPGGRLAFSTFAAEDEGWKPVFESWRPLLPELDGRQLRPPSASRFPDDAAITGLLEGAGYVDVAHTHEEYDVRFSEPAQWLAFSRSHGGRAFWDAVPPSRVAEVEGVMTETIEDLARERGGVVARQSLRYTVARTSSDGRAVA